MIQLHHIHKFFGHSDQKVHCLNNISLSIDAGEFTVIAGPSGSGKTTLLNVIGLLDRPSEGQYLFAGEDMLALSDRQQASIRLKSIGFVFQAFNLMPVLTALENTEMIMELNGITEVQRRERALEVLHALGLNGLEQRYPAQLSGGQQQRVAVARAIASRPSLVIADEPTANLDSAAATALIEVMAMLNQQLGITFVFSSHDPRVIERARRLITLQDGKILQDQQQNQPGLITECA